MMELKRKVASGKAFGTNVRMISAAEAKEKFPLLEEDMIQGAMWDPDAGLVKPRSQTVAGILVDNAIKTGKAARRTPAVSKAASARPRPASEPQARTSWTSNASASRSTSSSTMTITSKRKSVGEMASPSRLAATAPGIFSLATMLLQP